MTIKTGDTEIVVKEISVSRINKSKSFPWRYSTEIQFSTDKDLTPCPFCKGKIYLFHIQHQSLALRRFGYRCLSCETYFFIEQNTVYKSEKVTEQEAIDAWNRRADNA